LEFCNGAGAQKTRMTPLPDCQNMWRYIHSFTHSTNIGQTDRTGKTIPRTDALHADAR